MQVTIDQAGRLVIPKSIRDEMGIRPGPLDLVIDGVGIRLEPIVEDVLDEVDGRLVIPASGNPIGDDVIDELRRGNQR